MHRELKENHMELFALDQNYKLFPVVEAACAEAGLWKVIELDIASSVVKNGYGAEAASLQLSKAFEEDEGSLFIDSEDKLIMVVRADGDVNKCGLIEKLKKTFSKGSFNVRVQQRDEIYELPKISVSLVRPSNIRHIMGERGVKLPRIEDRQARDENVILIVEDDPMMRKMAAKAIDECPSQVEECADGVTALEQYYEKNPDIVFLDIHLPGKIGHGVLKDILSLDPNAFVVMLSGDSAKEQVLGAVKMGAKGFVAKPFTKDKLLEYVLQCPSIKMPA